MPDLRGEIQELLDSPHLRENLEPLFLEALHWGSPQAQSQLIQVGVPLSRALSLVPVAQLGSLPVYRVDWESDRLPNLTQRRAIHRALVRVAAEHLLCYVTADGQQAAFVWARPRGKGDEKKIELRSLPYEVGFPARTTIERLAELAFSYDDFDLFGEPRIGAVTDKLNAAFDVEAVTRQFFRRYREVFEQVEQQIAGVTGEALRLFAQKLFNRLMFTVFLERKRWLSFQGRRDYLSFVAGPSGGAGLRSHLGFLLWSSASFILRWSEHPARSRPHANQPGRVPGYADRTGAVSQWWPV